MKLRIATVLITMSVAFAGITGVAQAAPNSSPPIPQNVLERLQSGQGCVALGHIYPNLEQDPCGKN